MGSKASRYESFETGNHSQEAKEMQSRARIQHTLLMSRLCDSNTSYYSSPIDVRQRATCCTSNALVRMSAGMFSVPTNSGARSPALTWSLSQKKRKSRCFMRPWCSGFLATEMALWLSMLSTDGPASV